ncbi:MAG TPA: hypothetical protein VFJ43_09985 [Bacteroidia bacterium]|nr:hypothetical protein [Bacteroidia bacterium]
MKISLAKRRIVLLLTLGWAITILFLPIRIDHVSGRYTGTTPDNQKFIPADEEHVSSLAVNFNGHPAGIPALFFFALMPFFVVAETFSFRRPFSLTGKPFLLMQAFFLFLGGPYCYYMITYQQGNFYDTVHKTSMAWGGVILVVQNVLLAAFLFISVANQKGKLASVFMERK